MSIVVAVFAPRELTVEGGNEKCPDPRASSIDVEIRSVNVIASSAQVRLSTGREKVSLIALHAFLTCVLQVAGGKMLITKRWGDRETVAYP